MEHIDPQLIQTLILGSASPRRKELLALLDVPFLVRPSTVEEVITETEPAAVVTELSLQKATDVYNREKDNHPSLLVIGADTIVAYEGEILGKPIDELDAYRMLQTLQGNTHRVYTGVTLIWGEDKIRTFCTETRVHVSPMDDAEIRAYIKSGEPMDKAGAYGIQTAFGKYIAGIDGDYNNVVGLPVADLYRNLKELQLTFDAHTQAKTDSKEDSTTETKTESKTESRAETKAETKAQIKAQITPQLKQLLNFGCIFLCFVLFSVLAIAIWFLPTEAVKLHQKGFLLVIDLCVVIALYYWLHNKFV